MQISFLLLGKIIGIGITYATLIFVARKVTVEEYGLLSTVRAFVGSFYFYFWRNFQCCHERRRKRHSQNGISLRRNKWI